MRMDQKVAASMNLDPGNPEHLQLSRAAIQAMRNPTVKMREAAHQAFTRTGAITSMWNAMIDAALSE